MKKLPVEASLFLVDDDPLGPGRFAELDGAIKALQFKRAVELLRAHARSCGEIPPQTYNRMFKQIK